MTYRFAVAAFIWCILALTAMAIPVVAYSAHIGPWQAVPHHQLLRENFPGNYGTT